MIALMSDPRTGEPCGVHRTFLSAVGTGKAAILDPKRMLGEAGVVRPAEPEGNGLALAEGIENALTAMQVIGWGPLWAAGTAGAIARFPVLPGYNLTVFADPKPQELAAAEACARRWSQAGRECLVHVPPEGLDWNDVACRRPAP
jgi:hypothetical protein